MMAWNDYADFSSLDTLRLTAPLDGIRPLIFAVNERCVTVGISELDDVEELDQFGNILLSISEKIAVLVPYFVNNLESAGDYTGLTSIPIWTNAEIRDYGTHADGSLKGLGYFGELPLIYDDTSFATEISITVDIDGTPTEIPTLVPTLTDDEIIWLLSNDGFPPDAIVNKAIDYAIDRLDAGLSVWAQDGEQSSRTWMFKLFKLDAYWLWRQYEILNKLVWVKKTAITYTQRGINLNLFDKATATQAMDDAIAYRLANGGGSLTYPVRIRNNVGYRFEDPTYSGTSDGIEAEMSVVTGNDGRNYGIDVYIYANPPTSYDKRIFDSAGLGFVEKLNIAESGSSDQSIYVTSTIGDWRATPTKPSTGYNSALQGWNCTDTGHAAIIKYNVSGGFDFQ